jgi:photosystem II stability/assembly factor-like uncharacterized protein
LTVPSETLEVVDTGGRRIAGISSGIAIQDGSSPWRQTLNSQWQVDTIAVSPSFESDRRAVAASIGGPLYRTTDGGDTWNQVAALSNAFELAYLSPSTVIAAEEGADTWQDF